MRRDPSVITSALKHVSVYVLTMNGWHRGVILRTEDRSQWRWTLLEHPANGRCATFREARKQCEAEWRKKWDEI
jgi:hypothetical protein